VTEKVNRVRVPIRGGHGNGRQQETQYGRGACNKNPEPFPWYLQGPENSFEREVRRRGPKEGGKGGFYR